ncbi:hypothetical protein [Moraxella lacunata]|uniref:hypothetical protein n=1 Tax=Moraxella lacunata TaxID=477 RepID=UPI003EDFC4B0
MRLLLFSITSLKLVCEFTSFGGGVHLHRHRSSFRAGIRPFTLVESLPWSGAILPMD